MTAAGPVRARDVQVAKLFRARCHRPGCDWKGGEHPDYQGANAERVTHLDEHAREVSVTASPENEAE